MKPDPHSALEAMPATPPRSGAPALALRALQLRSAWIAGSPSPALKERNLALLCEDPSLPVPLAIYRAAVDLGARVSLVRPRFDALDSPTTANTGRMLGRLYDGVVCIGLGAGLVQSLRQAAGVPMLDDGIVADVLGGPVAEPPPAGGAPDELRFIWQAALVEGLN
jgi:ornithine carbamoyltransferase